MKTKHLSQQKLEDYFLGNLSTDDAISAGIHIDECRECFFKAKGINERITALETQLDSLGTLPELLELLEDVKKEHLEQIDKNTAIKLIKKLLDRVDEFMRPRLEELLVKLKNPAFQVSPLSALISKSEIAAGLEESIENKIEKKKVTPTVLPGKNIQLQKHNKNHVECRVHSAEKDLPTIFTPSIENGIDILEFNKVKGKDFYSALIPKKVVDRHFVVHKKRITGTPLKKNK